MLRIAWFTAWSDTIPLRSSVVSAAAVSWLTHGSDRWEIEVFVGDKDLEELATPAEELAKGCDRFGGSRVYHYLRAWDRHQSSPFDLFVYSIEDSPRCRFAAEIHHSLPGIVIAHDVNLNKLCWSRFAHTTAPTEINQEMDTLFGSRSARLGDAFVRGWPLDAFDRIYRRGSVELNRAQRIVVSESYLRRSLSTGLFGRSVVIPVPLECFAPKSAQLAEVVPGRLLLDAASSDISAVRVALRAFGRLRADVHLHWLVTSADELERAHSMLDTTEDGTRALITIIAPDSFDGRLNAISSAQLVLSPSSDEYRGISFVSGTALSTGKPLVISAIGSGEGLPDSVAVKVTREYCERGHYDDAAVWSAAITAMLGAPELSRALGQRASDWAAGERSVGTFCERLRSYVREELVSLKLNRRVTERRYLTAQALHVHTLMERLDEVDLWRDDNEGNSIVFNSVLKAATKDFGWLETPDDETRRGVK